MHSSALGVLLSAKRSASDGHGAALYAGTAWMISRRLLILQTIACTAAQRTGFRHTDAALEIHMALTVQCRRFVSSCWGFMSMCYPARPIAHLQTRRGTVDPSHCILSQSRALQACA